MFERINSWWLGLEPGEQFMYWIIALCLLMISGIAMLLGAVGFYIGTSFPAFLFVALSLISCFIGLFMSVVIFLTVIWPHSYQIKTKKSTNLPK